MGCGHVSGVGHASPNTCAARVHPSSRWRQCLGRTKFLVLDEADRVLDASFKEDLDGDKVGKTVETVKQQYSRVPPDLKELYLAHILSNMEEEGIRSAIVFFSTCRTCHYLELLLEEVDQSAVALHSHKSQSLRLASLSQFKSGQASVLLATDVASRGLDIPTVDLVINYNIPSDYIHRVGRTAIAGRDGCSVSFKPEKIPNLV